MQSLRLLLALSVLNDWKAYQIDVKTAFLYGNLEEEIYMKQPEGFIKEGNEHLVCKLKKSLYGLKQAPRVWHEEIKGTLIELGFTQLTCDNGIFKLVNEERYLILAVWVDDMPIFYKRDEDRQWLTEKLKLKYELQEGNLEYILGIKIIREEGIMKINQQAYIENKVKEYGLQEAKGCMTPMIMNQKLNEEEEERDDRDYRELIGSLMHSMVYTRPDIGYAVSVLSRSLGKSTRGHYEAGKRVLRYLKQTKNLSIQYSKEKTELEVYVDSADEIQPHYGYVIKLAGGAISWKSTKAKFATLSSAESEYIALTSVTQEVVWLRELLCELGFEQNRSTKIFEDNQAAIAIAKNPVQQGRTKHLGRRLAFVKDAIKNDQINLEYCPTEVMVADMLTKAINEAKFIQFRQGMGLKEDIKKKEDFEVGVLEYGQSPDMIEGLNPNANPNRA